MHEQPGPVRVFVGTDRSQLYATRVLEFSIRRRTSHEVVVRPMHDLDLPEPKDERQGKRTPFSFTRFAIPRLAGYQGRALYLDADMLVFKDIAELWSLPFDGAKVLVQEDPPENAQGPRADGSTRRRIRQTSVMLLDCAALAWVPEEIISGLDGRYTYEQLMHEFCLLPPEEIAGRIPFRWNSLELKDESTCLIHYTDMNIQPWVSTDNPNGGWWVDEVRAMLAARTTTEAELSDEVARGYLRPSLLEELAQPTGATAPGPELKRRLDAIDRKAGFAKHPAVNRRNLERRGAAPERPRRLWETIKRTVGL